MSREAWCFWMLFGAGIAIGSMLSQASLPLTFGVGLGMLITSAIVVARMDEREFWRKIHEESRRCR